MDNLNMFHIVQIAVVRGFKCQAFADPEWFPVVVQGSSEVSSLLSIQSLKISAQIRDNLILILLFCFVLAEHVFVILCPQGE